MTRWGGGMCQCHGCFTGGQHVRVWMTGSVFDCFTTFATRTGQVSTSVFLFDISTLRRKAHACPSGHGAARAVVTPLHLKSRSVCAARDM